MPRTPKPLTAQWPLNRDPDIWPAGGMLYRVHHRRYGGADFNPTVASFRFSPVYDTAGAVIPSWYAGSSAQCAVAESLLHDIPVATGGTLRSPAFLDRCVTAVKPQRPLRLARLDTDGLRALRLDPTKVTDTEADAYPDTQKIAQRLHDDTTLDGLVWMSRRRNIDTALVLYGDRVDAADFTVDRTVQDFNQITGWQWLHDLVTELGIRLAPLAIR